MISYDILQIKSYSLEIIFEVILCGLYLKKNPNKTVCPHATEQAYISFFMAYLTSVQNRRVCRYECHLKTTELLGLSKEAVVA